MSALKISEGRLTYELPPMLEAAGPPEADGRNRDSVRMLVSRTSDGSLEDSSFTHLPRFLEAGDLVVLNTSGTIPAAIDASGEDGTPLVVHFSTQLDDGRWVVEPRRIVGAMTERWRGPLPFRRLLLADEATMSLEGPYMGSDRLWISGLELGEATLAWLAVHGRPIRYGYVDRPWPIEIYQNVYVTEPGSAEMPSAGRPFTPEVITRLVAKGSASPRSSSTQVWLRSRPVSCHFPNGCGYPSRPPNG